MGKSKKDKKAKKTKKSKAISFSEALRFTEGDLLSDIDPGSKPNFDGKKKDGKKALAEFDDELDGLQEKLFADGRTGGNKRILLVIQGMDTAGKGGIMRHVVGLVDPQGVELTAFKAPTDEEKEHPFLWRIRNALPDAGMIGVFDRSHYEDVLIVRVHDLVPESQWARRYTTINELEAGLAEDDVTIIKVMMHVSKKEQKERLTERLDRPDKHWKYNPGDVTERGYWDDYQEAYQVALDKTSTDEAPWFVVPADRKWYARLAVQRLLLEHLREMDLAWPKADFDVAEEKARLKKS
ncbi:polyphosphate kinase 2 family protein [Ornithinimicrobium sp. Arc0846-15]|nr:polyphosphate kinase 2 family protein [Ornithinimicrobium laminariae]